jgi:hypothetical protein
MWPLTWTQLEYRWVGAQHAGCRPWVESECVARQVPPSLLCSAVYLTMYNLFSIETCTLGQHLRRLAKLRVTMWCTGMAAGWQCSRRQASHGPAPSLCA